MKTIHIFSNEERKQLLQEFCNINDYSYPMVCEVMYENLLGEEAAKDFERIFRYFISGKLGINHIFIKFDY